MNTEIKTIDERVREQGRKRLKDQLETAFRFAQDACPIVHHKIPNEFFKDCYYWRSALERIRDAIFAEEAPAAEEAAITEFLKKVQSIEDQLQELREEVQ